MSFFNKVLCFIAVCTLAYQKTDALELFSDSGFFLDIPEGFAFTEGDGKTSFSFADPSETMLFQIKLYDGNRYASVKALKDDVVKKLGAIIDSEDFIYQRRKAALGDISFTGPSGPSRGYAFFVDGNPKNAQESVEADYLLLAYAPVAAWEQYHDFFLSCIDSFSIDREATTYPGPISQFDTPWNPSKRKPRELLYNGAKLSVPFDPREAEASQALVEREFRVLSAYAGVAKLDDLAWKRYYRMIYRDCYRRLDYLALVIAKSIMERSNTTLPDARERAKTIQQWTQGFHYERNAKSADFVNPLSAAFEYRGDCDSRALLMAILLHHDGIDAILMLSRSFSHALAGIDAEGPGARFSFESKEWLVAETTAKVDIGLIDKNMADPAAWIVVSFHK